MNCELPKLELKREELEARLATARLQGDLRAVDRIKVLLCKCDSEISEARAFKARRGVDKFVNK